jgi:hypothetical protein
MMTIHSKHSISRRLALAAGAAALVAALMPIASDAASPSSRLTRIQFNRTLALPGVTLPPGSYTFEIANPTTSANAVLVSSGPGQHKVHFLGLTRRIERPRNLQKDQVITIGEAPAGMPVPITAWYPIGSSSGHQFVYP